MADGFYGHDIGPGVVYENADVKVTAVENTHLNIQPGTPPYRKYRSWSYRFDTPGGVVFFTAIPGLERGRRSGEGRQPLRQPR